MPFSSEKIKLGDKINIIQSVESESLIQIKICIKSNQFTNVDIFNVFCSIYRAVTDPRDGRRVALKKLPNVFQSLVSSKRVFRELKMLCFFKHENVSIPSIIFE